MTNRLSKVAILSGMGLAIVGLLVQQNCSDFVSSSSNQVTNSSETAVTPLAQTVANRKARIVGGLHWSGDSSKVKMDSGGNITGWAFRPNEPLTPLSVRLKIDGSYVPNVAKANRVDTFIQKVICEQCNIGFSFAVPIEKQATLDQEGKPHEYTVVLGSTPDNTEFFSKKVSWSKE